MYNFNTNAAVLKSRACVVFFNVSNLQWYQTKCYPNSKTIFFKGTENFHFSLNFLMLLWHRSKVSLSVIQLQSLTEQWTCLRKLTWKFLTVHRQWLCEYLPYYTHWQFCVYTQFSNTFHWCFMTKRKKKRLHCVTLFLSLFSAVRTTNLKTALISCFFLSRPVCTVLETFALAFWSSPVSMSTYLITAFR